MHIVLFERLYGIVRLQPIQRCRQQHHSSRHSTVICAQNGACRALLVRLRLLNILQSPRAHDERPIAGLVR